MYIKEYILKILSDDKSYSFESILACIVATKLNDPHLNEKSVRLCMDIQNEVWKCLQEMLSYRQIDYNNGFRKKKK